MMKINIMSVNICLYNIKIKSQTIYLMEVNVVKLSCFQRNLSKPKLYFRDKIYL